PTPPHPWTSVWTSFKPIRIPIFPRQGVFDTKNALPLYKTKGINRLHITLTDLESNSKFVNISVIYLIYK
ncbi:MAG: hypothetical protein J6Q00_04715, partial [Verrucomicrobia bacterium]|nr:hypothetical protein [Verrucomicrobiota bacterium]